MEPVQVRFKYGIVWDINGTNTGVVKYMTVRSITSISAVEVKILDCRLELKCVKKHQGQCDLYNCLFQMLNQAKGSLTSICAIFSC